MIEETKQKLLRVKNFLEANGYTGLVLQRQDSFSWITSGGSDCVVLPQCEGFAAVVITIDNVYLVAQVMDGQRIMDEEMSNLPAEYVPLRWYEPSVLDTSLELAGSHPAADVVCKAQFVLGEIYDLQYPLFPSEIETLKRAGRIADEALSDVAGYIRPGMSDYEAEAKMLYEFAKRGATCDVALVGSDERIFNYRHPTPVGAKLGKYVLLSPAVRYKGLHCNLSRSVYFGDRLPERVINAYETVLEAEANCASRCVTGVTYESILEEQKLIFAKHGFLDDWKGHYPGGRTGYCVCQAGFSLDKTRAIGDAEAFEWFMTVPGAKCAELTVKNGGDIEIASMTGLWPARNVAANGRKFTLPEIMLL